MPLFLRTKNTTLLWAALLSTLFALDFYFFLLHPSFFRKRDLLLAALLWLAFLPLLFLLLGRFLLPRLHQYSPRAQRNWFLLTFAVCILSSLVIRPSLPFPLLLPTQSLQVNIPPGSADRILTLEWVSNEFGDVSFDDIPQKGNWVRNGNILTFSGPDPASLSWSGRPGSSATLVFSDSPALKEVLIGWDGHLSPLDTSHVANNQVPLNFSFPPNWPAILSPRLLIGLTSAFLFLLLTLFLVGVQVKPAPTVQKKKGYWLLYTLPMIAVWVFFLLIFFPGLMSQDPIIQWQQVLTNQYVDQHPIFYALFIALLSKVYYSPASVVIANILIISLALSWGFAELEQMGVSRKVLWSISVICAVLPVNIFSAISLRKDILYSAAFLVLSIMFLKIINSKGNWLKNHWNWIAMGLILGLIDLTRFNGIPVVFGSIICLLIFFRQIRWQLAAAAGIFIIMHLIMYGPVYSLLKVKHSSEYGTIPILQHIAAHLDAGTPLDPDDADYLAQLAPLDAWEFSCCTANPTMHAIFPGYHEQNYDLPLLKQDIQKPTRIALRLFLKDPLVDLNQLSCASQLVWSLNSSCSDVFYTSLRPLSNTNPAASNIILPNEMGFIADSKVPNLITNAHPYLQVFSNSFFHKVNYTPAIYLYLSIYITAVLAYRKKDWRFLFFLVPTIFQSATLLIVNISPQFRYQYGVILVGFICLGFLFVPGESLNATFRGKNGVEDEKYFQ